MADMVEIKRIAVVLRDIRVDIAELKKAAQHLVDRELNTRRLISEGKFDKEAMEKSLEMLPVEKRKVDDMIDQSIKREDHYLNILNVLSSAG